jgi:hypothetical protein
VAHLHHQNRVTEFVREVLLPPGKRTSVHPPVELLDLRLRQLGIYHKKLTIKGVLKTIERSSISRGRALERHNEARSERETEPTYGRRGRVFHN